MAEEFGKDALNVIKLASVTALIIGSFQMAFYTLWYQVPFPFSLANLAVILSMVPIAALVLIVATALYFSSNFLTNSAITNFLKDYFRKDQERQYLAIGIALVVLLVVVLLPVTTGYILEKIGLGGGLRVVYGFTKAEQDPVTMDLLEQCSASGACVSKPLYLVIDSGDYVYVRPDWKDKEIFYGIKKSEIAFVKKVP